ncbi:MAG: vWA domain-containing protein [Myxococcota bacterium]
MGRFLGCLTLLLTTAVACGPTVSIDSMESGNDSGGPGGSGSSDTSVMPGSGDESPNDDGDSGDVVAQTNEVDILFIIDNSGSMGEEQGALAYASTVLVEILDEFQIDYRIGITTTDNSNPWCPSTTPEGGDFRLTSCRQRQSEFVFSAATTIDATNEACLEPCTTDSLTVIPTPGEDGSVVPRPWIEVTDGVSNIEGASVAEALRCAIPQGINGCGFEQQLESLHKAVTRTSTAGEAAFGFFRPGSVRAIMVISDEADCSHQDESIFLPDGPRTFWSLPDEPAPTSAVCWNAGVSCADGDCQPTNFDTVGFPTMDAGAVLRPVSRYIDQLQTLENAAKAVTPGADVILELVGGFGPDQTVVYQPTADQEFMNNFGIGPGCTSATGEAVPMVRALAVADAMSVGEPRPIHSICAGLDAPMTALAQRIVVELGL